MVTQSRVRLQTLVLVIFVVHLSRPVCVDVPSETDAVLGNSMKLTCIYCMKRDEIKSTTRVNWFFMPNEEKDIPSDRTHIYEYDVNRPVEVDGPFKGRLAWNGSPDMQDVSIRIINVTYNDSGIYECIVSREFKFDDFRPSVSITKEIKLKVKPKESPKALTPVGPPAVDRPPQTDSALLQSEAPVVEGELSARQQHLVLRPGAEFGLAAPPIPAQSKHRHHAQVPATGDAAALYSEIMMYVLLVCLTFWLLVEMVYCYRKISKSDEQIQDTATDYLAIPSEQKDNPTAPVTE